MDQSQDRQKEIYMAQKAILAYLNSKQDNRATSKELIDNVNCAVDILCESTQALNEQGFINGPVFSREIIEEGGNNGFRHSTQLTESGQEKYIAMIRDEQAG